jgi:hypothetical protein
MVIAQDIVQAWKSARGHVPSEEGMQQEEEWQLRVLEVNLQVLMSVRSFGKSMYTS